MDFEIFSDHLLLRTPCSNDEECLHTFDERNKAHLSKWETITHTKSEDYETLLRNWKKEQEEGKSLRFLIFRKNEYDKLIGICHFTQIFRASFQACYLGYKIDQKEEGKGVMYEALEKLIPFIIEDIGLHRIMANYMPANLRSANLLKRLGFGIEGFAKNYLKINERWEDHVLTALSKEDWDNRNEAHFFERSNGIREIALGDLAPLVSLIGQLGYPIDAASMEDNIKAYSTLPHLKAWVIERSGKVVGVLSLAVTESFHRRGRSARILSLVIDEAHRRLKLGEALIKVAEEYAKSKGCSYLELTSGMHRKPAHQFYRSLGFDELNDLKKYYAKKI